MIELHESADFVLVGYFLEISLDFWTRGIELGPVGIGFVDECVAVCGDITGNARVLVLVPCPSDLGVLLIYD
jgi:hypothetical protein